MTQGDRVISWLSRKQRVRTYYNRIEDDFVVDTPIALREFVAGKSYFRVGLSEFYLRDRIRMFRDYIPLAVVLCEFHYGGGVCRVPCYVDVRTLADTLPARNAVGSLHLRNTKIVGLMPFLGGDVTLFVGLFCAVAQDHLKSVFDLLGQLLKVVDPTRLTTYLRVSNILYDGLTNILGLNEVEFRFGTGDRFGGQHGSANRFRSGYLVYVNAPERDLAANNFWVKSGRLYLGDGQSAVEPYEGHDFCVLCIEHFDQRTDFCTLPFHKLWEDTQDLVWRGQVDMARLYALPALARAVKESTDLIPDDKSAALLLYKGEFEREVEGYRLYNGSSFRREDLAGIKRGKRNLGELDAQSMLQKASHVARESIKDKDTEAAFWNLANNLEIVLGPAESDGKSNLTNETMARQFDNLRRIQGILPNPQHVADAIMYDVIDTFGGRPLK